MKTKNESNFRYISYSCDIYVVVHSEKTLREINQAQNAVQPQKHAVQTGIFATDVIGIPRELQK